MPKLDMQYIHTFTGSDHALEEWLLTTYIEQTNEALSTMKKCVATGDQTGWAAAAHMLKSSSAGVGASALSHLCAEAQGATPNQSLYKRLVDEYHDVHRSLTSAGYTLPPAC